MRQNDNIRIAARGETMRVGPQAGSYG